MFIRGSIQAQDINPQSLYGHETSQSVYVRDSAVAVEKFALAERMEHLKEWDKAADVYQEILKTYADRVVPSQLDSDDKIYQYTSVTPAIQERLSKWPAEGLQAYRAKFESEAAAMLESAGNDPAQLHHIYSTYFITDSAKQAAIRMIDVYLERGEFAAAAWVGDRLLNWHPSLNNDRPLVLYRTALAYHLAGNDEQAQAKLKDLKDNFPQAVGGIRGKDVTLADSLAQELSAGSAKLNEASPNSWPMVFGSPDRATVPQVSGFGGARIFYVELPKNNYHLSAPQRKQLEDATATEMKSGLLTDIYPVVDRGEMFFQDNAHIYAVSLDSGLPLAGWAQTYDGDRQGRYTIPAAVTPRATPCTVTLTNDSVLAVMGHFDLSAIQFVNAMGQHDTRLVCLDRETGKQKWIVQPQQFPDSAANLRSVEMIGSPLAINDTVYVQARGGKGMQFEDSYVLAFNLADGSLKWSCYVASSNSGNMLWDGDPTSLFAPKGSPMAYSSGRLYVLTNLGAVAAVDAYDGTIVWLNIYPRDVADGNRFMAFRGGWPGNHRGTSNSANMPWACNPVIVSQGKVFVLPTDGLNVHVYDAGSGIENKRIPLNMFNNSQTMLGVMDDKLLLNDDQVAYCINWPNFDSNKPAEANMFWKSSKLSSNDPSDMIAGRGFVTTENILIPTSRRLIRLTWKSGSVVDSYPAGENGNWSDDESPGNVLLTQDRLIIAGPTANGSMRVNVYTDLNLAISKLDSEVAAAPGDPVVRLRYANMMFVAGKLDAAVAKLDDAIGLSAGNEAMRNRVFNTALSFAQKLSRDNRRETMDVAPGLFDRASATASTPSQKVNYRISRATLATQQVQPELEVKLYQEILSDPSLRAVPVADADGNTVAAGELARRQIDFAIQRNGQNIYSVFEQSAHDAYDTAKKSNDPAQFMSVAQTYPNSAAAPMAMLTAADLYESAQDPRQAAQVLRQVYFRYADKTSKTRLIEALARNYLLLPNHIDVAIARLNMGAKLSSDYKLAKPLMLHDGTKIENVTFAAAASALRAYRSASGKELPDVMLPPWPSGQPKPVTFVPEDPNSIVPGVQAIVVPKPQYARNDRVITFTTNVGLRVFAVGNTKPVMSCDAVTFVPNDAAWMGQNLLVWNSSELAYLADDGHLLWKSSLKTMSQVEVVASNVSAHDGDAQPVDPQQPIDQSVLQPGVVINGPVNINNNGQRIVVQLGAQLRIVRGQIQQNVPVVASPENEQIVHVRPLSDRIIIGTTMGRIIALDADNGGKILWQTRLGDQAATHLLASDDFVVARGGDENNIGADITVYDAFSGQVLAHRSFGADGNAMTVPLNLALADDGTLVYLTPEQVCGIDLFDPGSGLDKPKFATVARRNDGIMPFQISAGPDALQIVDDRIIVLGADSQPQQPQQPQMMVLRMFSLDDGSIMQFKDDNVLMRFSLSDPSTPALVRGAGSTLYVATQHEVHGFDLSKGSSWLSPLSSSSAMNVRDMTIARGHVLVFAQPAGVARGQAAIPLLQLDAFSRELNNRGTESGKFEHQLYLSAAQPVLEWQVVDGGIYYLATDNTLHYLHGSRDAAKK